MATMNIAWLPWMGQTSEFRNLIPSLRCGIPLNLRVQVFVMKLLLVSVEVILFGLMGHMLVVAGLISVFLESASFIFYVQGRWWKQTEDIEENQLKFERLLTPATGERGRERQSPELDMKHATDDSSSLES